jgi:parvulin-like peptidyl-prolyl isomerase
MAAVTDHEAAWPAEPARPPSGRRLKRLGARVLREPLAHFFAVGLLLFAAAEHHRHVTDFRRIVVTPQDVARLGESYRLQFGADPTPQGLSQLVDKYVDEEVLYREGMALKLDRDDEVVRRRVAQKTRFLEQDLSAPQEPSQADLEAYYRGHRAAYAAPAKVAFTHIFFADGKAGEAEAHRRALAALAKLGPGVARAPSLGDDFPGLFDYADFDADQATRLFGQSALSQALFQAPVGRWAGPFRSAYGWHLLRVASVRAPAAPPLDAVRDKVRADLLQAEEDAANARAFAQLKARFTIVRPDAGSLSPEAQP